MSHLSNNYDNFPDKDKKMMHVPNLLDILPTDSEIEESNRLFELCGDAHDWVDEDDSSPFYKRCTRCGGAEGIKMLKGFI